MLCGQPELDARLDKPELEQLKQRVSVRRRIQPLIEKETYEYIQHRLEVADSPGIDLFEFKALSEIWNYTAGVPRKINILCDNALNIAFRSNKKIIDQSIILQALKDLRWKRPADVKVTPEGVAINAAVR